MTIFDSLKALSGYPIPYELIQDAMEELELVNQECTSEIRKSKEYKAAKAKIFRFLEVAPNVSQGGISYSFTDESRQRYRRMADKLEAEIGEEGGGGVEYGYQGDSF